MAHGSIDIRLGGGAGIGFFVEELEVAAFVGLGAFVAEELAVATVEF